MELGYVQFMSHKGLCPALDREAIVGDQIVVVEPSDREFIMEWKQCCPVEMPPEVRGTRKVLNARKVKKGESGKGGGDGGSAMGSRTYRGEEDANQIDVQWIKIKGKRKSWEGKKGPIRFEESASCAEGEVDLRDRNPLMRYSAGTSSREDVERNERCSSSSDSTGQI